MYWTSTVHDHGDKLRRNPQWCSTPFTPSFLLKLRTHIHVLVIHAHSRLHVTQPHKKWKHLVNLISNKLQNDKVENTLEA